MKRTSFAGMILLLVAAVGLGQARAQSVTTDFDKQANFSLYKTYAWGVGTPVKNPFMDQRIIAAIDQELAAKGFTKVAADPDVIVIYHGAVTQQVQFNTMNYGWGPRFGGGMAMTSVEQIPVGQLTVDIGDAKTKKLLWLGTATDSLDSNPDKNTKKVNKAVAKMFKKFPPQQK